MTATEELRRLLDERGVEWDYGITGSTTTEFSVNGVDITFTPMRDGLECSTILTPEQAVAATLGAQRPTLPHFWTADGTLHVEPRRMPERVQAHLGGEDVTFERGLGACRIDALNTGDCAGYECSEYIMHCNGCGHEFGHVLYNEDGDVWMSELPNFCPNCGKRVVE